MKHRDPNKTDRSYFRLHSGREYDLMQIASEVTKGYLGR